jgi:anti-sigma regulatory factor (Ser/Thr protein kinase)
MAHLSQSLDARFAAEADAIVAARDLLSSFARDAGLEPPRIDDIRLAVSEAVTNAVRHGYRGRAGEIRVTARVRDDSLRIVIRDEGCGMRRHAATPGMGLGLGLIAELADEMAIGSRERGTELAMRFALAPAAVLA